MKLEKGLFMEETIVDDFSCIKIDLYNEGEDDGNNGDRDAENSSKKQRSTGNVNGGGNSDTGIGDSEIPTPDTNSKKRIQPYDGAKQEGQTIAL